MTLESCILSYYVCMRFWNLGILQYLAVPFPKTKDPRSDTDIMCCVRVTRKRKSKNKI